MNEGLARKLLQAEVPGSVCLVIKQGEVVFHEAFGSAVREPLPVAMEKDTVFDIASLTKIVTSTLILKLVSEQTFALSSNVDELLPEVAGSKTLRERLSGVSVQNLLSHSSGLPAWYPFYTRKEEDFFTILADILTEYPKENCSVYSDLNFMLLGKIIETETSLSLKDAVEHYISKPLGLPTLFYNPLHTPKDRIAATEYGNQIEQGMCRERGLTFDEWRPVDQPIHGQVNDGNGFYYFNGVASHAGLFANAEDVAKLGQLYLNEGVWHGEQWIDKSVIQAAKQDYGGARGLGWQFAPMFPEGYGHTGFTGTSLWISDSHQLITVLLTNRLHTEKPKALNELRQDVHQEILKAFYKKEVNK
ncbi:serine hydrolase domain-containing protein [Halobacillus sp. MO56]